MTSNRTADRLNRILALIPFVLEKGVVDVEEILDRFGYTRDQLMKDLNTVFVCGLPGYGPGDLMEAYLDEDDVIIDAADYFKRAPKLTSTEALGLLVAGLTVIGAGQGTPALESAVSKLMAKVVPDADPALTVDVVDPTEHVPELKGAAVEGRVVRITYTSVGKEQTTVRDIEPWSVFHTMGRWYVAGHCRLVEDQRTFRVDRIRSLEETGETFTPPEERPEPGVGYSPSDGDVAAVIDLGTNARWVLEYYPVEVLSDDGTAARIRFWAPDPEVIARLLVRLGSSARLVEGAEVAQRLRELGDALLRRHVLGRAT
ncbi:MAG TPA: WYL domain-containing protein [Acidimicrobiia bacterium]